MKTRVTERLPGTTCNICGKEDLKVIIDSANADGHWAHMCEECHYKTGHGPATKFVLGKLQDRHFTKEEEQEYADGFCVGDLESMMFDGDIEAIDGCIVDPDGQCQHGYSSPLLLLNIF